MSPREWGYLPEERGLYPKMRMDEQLLLLARLQGVSKQEAGARLKLENDPEANWLDMLAGVQVIKRREDYIEMHIQANLTPHVIVEAALHHGGIISRFELTEPSLTESFIEQVGALAFPDTPDSELSAWRNEE